jgi:hypothetical protein
MTPDDAAPDWTALNGGWPFGLVSKNALDRRARAAKRNFSIFIKEKYAGATVFDQSSELGFAGTVK